MAKRIAIILLALLMVGLFQVEVSAQGGWRQWKIHFLDGTSVEASPLQLRADGLFTRSMGDEPGFERSKIDYFAIVRRNLPDLPPLPKGTFTKDLVVMMDGTHTLGAVTFIELKFSEGTIKQNGKEITLENVAYIKFAHPKRRKARSR